MNTIECPYCGEENEIDHSDGFGYAENETHQMQCEHCEKYFVFTTGVVYVFYPEKADCLNGAEHSWELTHTYPNEFSKMHCSQCDKRREPTPEERVKFGLGSKEDYFKSL